MPEDGAWFLQEVGTWFLQEVQLHGRGGKVLPACSPLGLMMLLVSRNFWALTSFVSWETHNFIGAVGAHLRGSSAALSLCPRQLLGVMLAHASGSPADLGSARAHGSTRVLKKERQQFRAEAEAPAAAELWSTTGPIPLNRLLSAHTHTPGKP